MNGPGKCYVAILSFLGDKIRGEKNVTSGTGCPGQPRRCKKDLSDLTRTEIRSGIDRVAGAQPGIREKGPSLSYGYRFLLFSTVSCCSREPFLRPADSGKNRKTSPQAFPRLFWPLSPPPRVIPVRCEFFRRRPAISLKARLIPDRQRQ